jgi:influenza virus NS1A-binding protein
MPASRNRVRAEMMDSDRMEDLEDLKEPQHWDQDKLIYEDKHHKNLVLSSLNTLRRNRDFCDVVLQVGHADIHVHRAVLASQSRFFYQLFSESEESDQKSLPFHYKLGDNFDVEAFESLVNYAYTSRLEISTEKVKAVYKTALVLKMETPMSICAKYLVARLSVENCLGIRQFANSLYDCSLSSHADAFIKDKILSVIESSPEFRLLPKIKVEIVSTVEEDSRSFNEGHVSALVLDWLRKSIQENHDRLEELVENDVNLLYLHSDNTLHDCIECNDNDDTAALNNSEIIQDYKKSTNKRTIVRNELSSNNLAGMGGGSGKSRSGSDESLYSGTETSIKSGDFLETSPKSGWRSSDSETASSKISPDQSENGNGLPHLNGKLEASLCDFNSKVPSKLKKFTPENI